MPAVIREKLVRGLDTGEIAELDKSYEKFLDLIKESSLETFHENYQVKSSELFSIDYFGSEISFENQSLLN